MGRRRIPGLLSIVVPVYRVERYVDACLTTLRAQTYPHLEIVVVDDDSPDDSLAIVARHARRDPRIRIVRRPNGGLSAARNTGAAAARGEYLTFVDSDDEVADPELYARVLATLEATGSDLAVTGYDRWEDGAVRDAAPWIRAAHARERLRTTLRDFPEIQVNAVAWSKVYRRSFYDEAGLRFPEGALFEDQPVSSRAYARARSFDVLPWTGVTWRVREDRSSISQQGMSLRTITAHSEAVVASIAELAEAAPYAVAARASQLLRHNMWFFTRLLPIAEDGAFEALGESVRFLLEHVDPEEYAAATSPYDKALNLLVARGDRARVETLLEAGRDLGRYRLVHDDGGVRCLLPMHDDPDAGLDADTLRIGDPQLTLRCGVDRARWAGPHLLEIEGWAFIRFVDMAGRPPGIEIVAASPDGERIRWDVSTFSSPRPDEVSPHAYCDYRPGGFRAVLDTRRLPPGVDRWVFELTIDVGGVRRTGPLTGVSTFGSAAVTRPSPSGEPRYVTRPVDDGLVLDRSGSAADGGTEDAAPLVTGFRVDDDRVVIDVAGGELDAEQTTAVLTRRGVEVVGRPESAAPGTLRLSFDLCRADDSLFGIVTPTQVALPPGVYRLLLGPVGDRPRRPVRPGPAVLDGLPSFASTGTARVRIGVGRTGGFTVALRPPLASDEVGARAQRLLREATLGHRQIEDEVFLWAPGGRSADLRAVHEALLARTSVTTWWSVPDRSASVPAGARAVVDGTREWYEAFARSRVLLLDGPARHGMTTATAQRVVQIGVPYPLTPWGYQSRTGRRAPESLLAADARVRDWDVVASPASLATRVLREQVLAPARADARVIETGSARNDVVLGDSAARLRAQARAALGLDAGTVAVLHAPAPRPWLAADSPLMRELDPARIAAVLGRDVVVLASGRVLEDAPAHSGDRVLDVSGADLTLACLASDAAVLDYTSLRFDYLLQDKPMVFLVPDLAQFAATEGFSVDEAATAAGARATGLDTLADAWSRAHDDIFARERERVRSTYLDGERGDAAVRLADLVLELLDRPSG